MKKRNGFTLIELIIVMAITVILAAIMIGIFNTSGVLNRGRDAQRKKDLNRIKTAFEEYFNDKGEYPQQSYINSWNIKENCGSLTIFAPYLIPWPCDPNGNPYKIFVENNSFRVLANLEYRNDNDIPENWYKREDLILPGSTTVDQINFGVSSSNILWYGKSDKKYPGCNTSLCAYKNIDGSGGCKVSSGSCVGGNNCYFYNGGSCTDGTNGTIDCEVDVGDNCPL